MRRAALIATAVLAAPAAFAAHAAPVAAGGRTEVREIAPARAFRRQLSAVRRNTRIAVLLPDTVKVDVPRGHGIEIKWEAGRPGWTIALGIGPRCGGANACFVGELSARRGERPSASTRVRLRGGRTGFFKPSTCGASCSPPQIQWRVGDVLYDVQFRAAGPGSDRAKLIALADSALAAGPR